MGLLALQSLPEIPEAPLDHERLPLLSAALRIEGLVEILVVGLCQIVASRPKPTSQVQRAASELATVHGTGPGGFSLVRLRPAHPSPRARQLDSGASHAGMIAGYRCCTRRPHGR